MTILELQKELQKIYDKSGNMNVYLEDVDFSQYSIEDIIIRDGNISLCCY